MSLESMERGPFVPKEEVVLAADTPAAPSVATMRPVVRAAPDAPAGEARIERYDEREVVVAVVSLDDAFLVLSDSFFPGWRAYLDGAEQPILRGDLLFRVVQIPTGDHEVIFRYEPVSLLLGLAISVLAGLLALAVLLGTVRSRRE
jgi:hypothetical protein